MKHYQALEHNRMMKGTNPREGRLASLRYLLFMAAFLWIHQSCLSQIDTSARKKTFYDSVEIKYDSAKNKLFSHIKKFGDSERTRNRLEYSEDTTTTQQDETIDLIKSLTLEAQTYLENGIDTTGLGGELNKIKYWYDITSDGVFINVGTIQTHRNLETSYKIMRELLIRVLARKSSLEQYHKKLIEFRNTIDSLYNEDILYKFSSDSAVLMRYVKKLTIISQEIKPIDSALKKTIVSVAELQSPVNMLAIKLNSSIDEILVFQQNLSRKIFTREATALWDTLSFARPFNQIASFSAIKTELSFVFYLQNELGKIVLLLILIAACAGFLVKLKRNAIKKQFYIKNSREHAVLKYPLLSAVFVVLNILQFVFIDPPFLFSVLIWTLSGLALTFILKGIVVRYWMNAWIILFTLFLFGCIDNLVLQASRTERWMMVVLSLIGLVTSLTTLLRGLKIEVKEKLLYYFIGFNVVLQAASIVTNFYGFYNMSKTFLTAGFISVVLAILFYWTIYLISQLLVFSAKVYDRPNQKLFNINFEYENGQAPRAVYLLLLIGWFVLFGRNFYLFRLIAIPLQRFIVEKREIGDFSFTIGSVLEFFLIIYISGIASKMISIFASNAFERNTNGRKAMFGSWVLIIRICIVTLGLLAAFAAVGIPMDRLTIIFSALSVGVGFGLQSLVNNLVSGLIISFERPVSVGDIVEVGKESGIVTSIGFRSSIITTSDGAHVVIPNGALLSSHLVNWTLEGQSRAVHITVNVVYGTDLGQAIKILNELPPNDKRILVQPPPTVIIRQFNDKAIELQLSFWVKNLAESAEIKTNMMLAIDLAFKRNAISMAFRQDEISTKPAEKI